MKWKLNREEIPPKVHRATGGRWVREDRCGGWNGKFKDMHLDSKVNRMGGGGEVRSINA